MLMLLYEEQTVECHSLLSITTINQFHALKCTSKL